MSQTALTGIVPAAMALGLIGQGMRRTLHRRRSRRTVTALTTPLPNPAPRAPVMAQALAPVVADTAKPEQAHKHKGYDCPPAVRP